MITLGGYPLTIDPASDAIDVFVTDPEAGQDKPRNMQLGRVTVDQTLPFTHTLETAHIFGEKAVVADCRFLFVYNHQGRLATFLMHMSNGDWLPTDPPPEMCGVCDVRPSIRYVFASFDDQNRFLMLMATMGEQVRNCRQPSPRDATELLMILGRAPEPPRILFVEPLNEHRHGLPA